MTLSDSVGMAATNRHADVVLVQRQLKSCGLNPGPIDGKCGRKTISAIVALQRRIMKCPDGRVNVDGKTWRHLTGDSKRATQSATTTVALVTSAVPTVDYNYRFPLPPPDTINVGVRSASNQLMHQKFGEPRSSYDQKCRPPTNERIASAIVGTTVGRTHVRGIKPAVESLNMVMREVARDLPDLYLRLGSVGMACCRNTRGSMTSVSNHSWGTAVDISIDSQVEPRGERNVRMGLLLISPYFNRFGWYWGAAFHTPDAHHFECGADLIARFEI